MVVIHGDEAVEANGEWRVAIGGDGGHCGVGRDGTD